VRYAVANAPYVSFQKSNSSPIVSISIYFGVMSNSNNFDSEVISHKLQAVTASVGDAIAACEGDTVALLALLRQLEFLHREIRDGVFQASLPENRQGLYALLREIEMEGGWPYIERMRLQAFLARMEEEEQK
jgi:hypothetical protein